MASGNSESKAFELGSLFRSLYDHMAEGVALYELVCDDAGQAIDYRILDVNPQFERYTGLRPDQVVGRLGTQAYGLPEAPHLKEYAGVARSGKPGRLETYFQPLDRHYEISIAPMGQGFFATIFLDVSAQRRQERALKDRELALQQRTEDLDRFFLLNIDLLCIADHQGRFVHLNHAWEQILGWSLPDLEGAEFLRFVHPEDRAETTRQMDKVREGGGVINFVNRYRCKNDDYRSIEWRCAPADNGRIYAVARDVTERLRYEDGLRAGEEKFRRIFELIPVPLTLTELTGEVIACNDAFCTQTGFSRDEVSGRNWGEFCLWEKPELRNLMFERLNRGETVDGVDFKIRRRDGQVRVMQGTARVFELVGRKVVLTAARDLTEQRNLEQQMLHSQKLESLGVLAGGIAHDFNNLLTGILGNADLAKTEISPLAPARNSLEGIEVSARRAADLCRQLLAYSGRGRFVIQPIDLQVLVEEMGHLLSVSISKKVVLKFHFAENLPAVEADATQIRQVVMNLIVNASEAIGERSGVISITTGMAYCDQAYLRGCFTSEEIKEDDFVYLEIADTGHGMDKATLDRIFDPFFSTKFTGRGLGLAAVLGIVRGHKGAIRVYSEPGRGTTFKLLFPASDKQARRLSSSCSMREEFKGNGLILLADDEETIRVLGRRMLQRSGFEVVLAEDGRQAVDTFKSHQARVRLVILDLTMPHLDGEACFRELRQIQPDVKVILSSGYNEQDVVNRFAGKGLAGFIQKPYTREELLAKLSEALSPDDEATQ